MPLADGSISPRYSKYNQEHRVQTTVDRARRQQLTNFHARCYATQVHFGEAEGDVLMGVWEFNEGIHPLLSLNTDYSIENILMATPGITAFPVRRTRKTEVSTSMADSVYLRSIDP